MNHENSRENFLHLFDNEPDVEAYVVHTTQKFQTSPHQQKTFSFSGTPIETISILMYSLGLIHYTILLFSEQILPKLKNPHPIVVINPEALAEELVNKIERFEKIDHALFHADAGAIKRDTRDFLTELYKGDNSRESLCKVIVQYVYALLSSHGWEVDFELLCYIVDHELLKYQT